MKTAVIKLKRLPTSNVKGFPTKRVRVPQNKKKFKLRVRLRQNKRIPQSKCVPPNKHVQRSKHAQQSKRGPQKRACLKK